MRVRTSSHVILGTLGALWLTAVASSLRYRDLVWIQAVFVDRLWLDVLLLAAAAYGALLVLAGALARPAPIPAVRARPLVSIVVPAKDEEAVIEATVRCLCAQTYRRDGRPGFEVVVVDDRSTDRTPAILAALAQELGIRVVRTPEGSVGKAAALNFGIAQSRGDVIAVFDADARIGPTFLQQMVPYLEPARVGGVQARKRLYNAGQNLLTRAQDDEYEIFSHGLQRARRAVGGAVCFGGNGLLLKRAALEDVGGWNEGALTEDVDLTVRFHLAGWEIAYCEEAVVWEEAVPRARALLRQRVRWFEGTLRCLGDYLPAILLGRLPLLKRLDLLFFLGGTLAATLALLTTYLYAVIDLAGWVVLYLHLPQRIAVWASGGISAAFLLGVLAHSRWRVAPVIGLLARSAGFSLHRLVVVPLAIHRYARSVITGQTRWEKTAHGSYINSA